MNEKAEAEFLIGLLNEKKTEDVVCFDISKISSIADYVIICTCSSNIACRAVAGYIEEKCKGKLALLGKDGERAAEWIVLDFGSVILHIFVDEIRKFYNLEKLYKSN